MDRHLGSFQTLAAVNSTAKNILILFITHGQECYLDIFLKAELPGHLVV